MSIRVGVVGCGYGAHVLVPAFRVDPRAEVVAISARRPGRAEEAARGLVIQTWFDDWRDMLDPSRVDAVAIAVPPDAQVEIARTALERGLSVFAEKPMAVDVAGAESLSEAAHKSGLANAIDFNFREIAALRMARDMVHAGALGELRHVAVTWQVENYANRARLESWKTDDTVGGGALFNFVSHSLDYLEWFLGPVRGLLPRLAGMPGDMRQNDTFVTMAFDFASGAAGSLVMSAAAYCGSGHRIEFYGEAGTIVLDNSTADYMRGFKLFAARRPGALAPVEIPTSETDTWEDGRVLPASRIARRFVDWAGGGSQTEPNFSQGLRVQRLLETARRSHESGRWIELPA